MERTEEEKAELRATAELRVASALKQLNRAVLILNQACQMLCPVEHYAEIYRKVAKTRQSAQDDLEELEEKLAAGGPIGIGRSYLEAEKHGT